MRAGNRVIFNMDNDCLDCGEPMAECIPLPSIIKIKVIGGKDLYGFYFEKFYFCFEWCGDFSKNRNTKLVNYRKFL